MPLRVAVPPRSVDIAISAPTAINKPSRINRASTLPQVPDHLSSEVAREASAGTPAAELLHSVFSLPYELVPVMCVILPAKTHRGISKPRTITPSPQEFLRRFLQHVLPGGFPAAWATADAPISPMIDTVENA